MQPQEEQTSVAVLDEVTPERDKRLRTMQEVQNCIYWLKARAKTIKRGELPTFDAGILGIVSANVVRNSVNLQIHFASEAMAQDIIWCAINLFGVDKHSIMLGESTVIVVQPWSNWLYMTLQPRG